MSNFSIPADNLVQEVRGYVDAQIDNVKLRTVKGLSEGTSVISRLLLIFIILGAFVTALSFAVILLLGEIFGSYALAAFIMSGVLLIVILLLVALRHRIFKNSFISMYTDVICQRDTKPIGLNTVEDLDEAILRGESQIKQQSERISDAYTHFKQFYSPKHIMHEAFNAVGISNENGDVKLSSLIPMFFRFLFSKKKK